MQNYCEKGNCFWNTTSYHTLRNVSSMESKWSDKLVTCHLTFPVINFIALMTTVISLSKYRKRIQLPALLSFLFSSPSNSSHSPLAILLWKGSHREMPIFCKNYRNVRTSENMIFNSIWSKIVCYRKLLPDGL